MNAKSLFAVAFLSLLIAGSCCNRKNPPEQSPAPKDRVVLSTPGHEAVEVVVEVVSTPQDRAKGLMYREKLEPLHGMLFLFPEPKQQTFWMKNTLIELDMIFIRADMSVLGCVERAEPQTTTPRYIPGESQYVLEVAGGFCAEHGIGPDTKARLMLSAGGSGD